MFTCIHVAPGHLLMMPHFVLLHNFWPTLKKVLHFDLQLSLSMFLCLWPLCCHAVRPMRLREPFVTSLWGLLPTLWRLSPAIRLMGSALEGKRNSMWHLNLHWALVHLSNPSSLLILVLYTEPWAAYKTANPSALTCFGYSSSKQ